MKKLFISCALAAFFAPMVACAGVPEDIVAKYPQSAGAKIEPAFGNFWSVIKGGEVVFISDDMKYLISGPVINTATGQNITQALVEANRPKFNMADLNLKDALKVKDGGSGAKKIYVFSDPDCPFCQKLEKSFDQLKNVTIYIFPMPLTQLHPNAGNIAQSIWCSKNQGKAWHDYVANGILPSPAKCDNPNDRNLALANKYQINGTPAIIFEDGSIIPGAAPAREIQAKAEQI